MFKAIVTGGAGFIGSHIVEELLYADFQVIALDNLALDKADNIRDFRHHPKLEYIQGNTDELNLLKGIFSGADYVFHYAAVPFTENDREDSTFYYQKSTKGILNVLQAAKDNIVKKVVYASSSAIYGDEPTLPKREDMIPNPISPYAATKLTAEIYCNIYSKSYNLSTICLRYFNVYGPRQSPNSQLASVIPRFISNVINRKPPVIFGDGTQTRDFVYVKDAVHANLLAAKSNITGIVNVGSGEATSLNRIAQLILAYGGNSEIGITYQEGKPGEIKHSVADISKARIIGYLPQYKIEMGLKETVDYWESRLNR